MKSSFTRVREETGLIEYFRQYYALVLRYKSQIRNNYDVSAREVFSALKDYLEHYDSADHTLDQRMFREARYAMAALADEIFLNLPWDGAKEWMDRLLENELFSSCICGELLFEKIREHLQTAGENRPPVFASLSLVYLYVLSLGFEGRFRSRERSDTIHPELVRFRRALYASARERAGEFPSSAELFPGADLRVPGTRTRERLPDVRRWRRILLGTILMYLFISTAVWFAVTGDLARKAAEIIEGQEQSPPS